MVPGLGSLKERGTHAVHWNKEYDALHALVREYGLEIIGSDDIRRFKLIGEFYCHVGDILAYTNDVLVSQDHTTLSHDGFAIVRTLIDQALD